MTSPKLQKQALRQTFRRKRGALTSSVRNQAHQRIAAHLTAFFTQRKHFRQVAIYLATPEEVDLAPWMQSAWAEGISLYAPVLCQTQGHMTFHAIDPQTALRKGRFGLTEPVPAPNELPIDPFDLDVALLPLLAFDDCGGRLGMGGGYYDRYFQQASRRPLIIGVAYGLQQAEQVLPAETWDLGLDGVVTESGLGFFNSSNHIDSHPKGPL